MICFGSFCLTLGLCGHGLILVVLFNSVVYADFTGSWIVVCGGLLIIFLDSGVLVM